MQSAVGSLHLSWRMGINFLSASAHKFHGPKGWDFMPTSGFDNFAYWRKDQENKHRAGTETVSIVGDGNCPFQKCCPFEENLEHAQQLKDTFTEQHSRYRSLSSKRKSAWSALCYQYWFPNQRNDLIFASNNLNGFSISTGSALYSWCCSAQPCLKPYMPLTLSA